MFSSTPVEMIGPLVSSFFRNASGSSSLPYLLLSLGPFLDVLNLHHSYFQLEPAFF